MTHADTAASVKEKVVSLLGLSTPISRLSLVEVLDHHISRIIDDWLLLKHLKDDRSIYVVEVLGASNRWTFSPSFDCCFLLPRFWKIVINELSYSFREEEDDPSNCDSEDVEVSSSSDAKTEQQEKSGKKWNKKNRIMSRFLHTSRGKSALLLNQKVACVILP